MDHWFLNRPRWERVLLLLLAAWCAFVAVNESGAYEPKWQSAFIAGPVVAFFVYFFARFASLAFRKGSE